MPFILILSLYGFSFSSRQLYPSLFPKLLSRATVHESLTAQDALNYLSTGLPSVILVTDPALSFDEPENKALLEAVVDWTKRGGTTIFMGFFAEAVELPQLENLMKSSFSLHDWEVDEHTSHEATLRPNIQTVRTQSLEQFYYCKALWLRNVPSEDSVYSRSGNLPGTTPTTCAAFATVGFGKLGYIGDTEFGEEPERIIIAMCRLDIEEDNMS
ncbi:uncharacterized protein BDZ99DRAFT_42203 [Mytilinidion resinicola]|uniref:Uncharacterized protein n=1 Tax=Mytilinidion resinicola TaxID=574789 RepID=A0A6A6YLR3_9PEZI|nr:uncharacterized protein BDZ99DRAFT_42203 [Mytilinidion resinicola]KAF2808924.1 hypothetical protein BDZ99DRAFT_42203 [Mytilinidion resinicola]